MSLRAPTAPLAIASLVSLAGCMASETQLRMRAASDFQCDTDKLEVTPLPHDVYAVSGCDRKESYVYSSEARAWIRASEAGGEVITLPR